MIENDRKMRTNDPKMRTNDPKMIEIDRKMIANWSALPFLVILQPLLPELSID